MKRESPTREFKDRFDKLDGLVPERADAAPRRVSRSALVRTAIRGFAEQQRRRTTEAHEDRILRTHRKRLARQAEAVIAEQARL